jgi:hypothetical protein
VYFFVIDVSAAAYACGMVSVVASTIKACLDQVPGDERTMVGFITYDSSLHFYNLKANLAAPQVGGVWNKHQTCVHHSHTTCTDVPGQPHTSTPATTWSQSQRSLSLLCFAGESNLRLLNQPQAVNHCTMPCCCLLLQMLVVTELDDPFLPMPDDLLVNLHDSRELVDALLDALPAGYNASTSNDAAMGPALQVWPAGADDTVLEHLRLGHKAVCVLLCSASYSKNNAAQGPGQPV